MRFMIAPFALIAGTNDGMTASTRRVAELRGRRAERRAALLLRLKGYRILATRFRCPQGEIDLIARRGRTLIFVEVKARSDEASAAAAIGLRQQTRITAAAEVYLQQNPHFADFDMRFDAVLIGRSVWPQHYVDAWRL